MVKSSLTVVERSVKDESNWQPVSDLASIILRSAAEKREKLVALKAAVARDHADALPPAFAGIWVQLDLPLRPAARPEPGSPVGRLSRL